MCTDFSLPKSTGFRVSGRTMDFAEKPNWNLVAIPKNTEMRGLLDPGSRRKAHRWIAKFGFLGIGVDLTRPTPRPSQTGQPRLFSEDVGDAMNTEGLTAAGLWLPSSEYPRIHDAAAGARLVSAFDICGWAAANYSNISDLRKDLERVQRGEATSSGKSIHFWGPRDLGGNQYVPLHFQFHDANGDSLVLEFLAGELVLKDNSDLGVLTNEPPLAWHRTNLKNYLNTTNVEPAKKKRIVDLQVTKPGNGGGSIGLSASPLPSDRFLRTVFGLSFSTPWLATEGRSLDDAVAHTLNLLKGVAVVRGQCIDHAGNSKGDFTQWHIVRDHDSQRMFLATTESLGTWCIDFADYDLTPTGKQQFVDLTNANSMPKLKPTSAGH